MDHRSARPLLPAPLSRSRARYVARGQTMSLLKPATIYSDVSSPQQQAAPELVTFLAASSHRYPTTKLLTAAFTRDCSSSTRSATAKLRNQTRHFAPLRHNPSWFLDVNRDTTKSSSSSQDSVVLVVELVLRPAAPVLSSSASRSYSAPVSLVAVASSLAAVGIVGIYSSVKLVSSNGEFLVICKTAPRSLDYSRILPKLLDYELTQKTFN
ncbi:hypothetical protein Bca4012_052013 [Brassica carinata]